MAFPLDDTWCLVEYDVLVEIVVENTNWLNAYSWIKVGFYHTANPSKQLVDALSKFQL